MQMKRFLIFVLCFPVLLSWCGTASAFTKDGCGDGNCVDCHSLTRQESATLLSIPEEHIVDLRFAEVPGLWEVDIRQGQQVVPVFIDFSKQYLISGAVVKIADKKDIARERFADLNRVDVARIPLEDALVLGKPTAPIRIIVFDDPQCPYCAKLHGEMKKLVAERPDIAFYIKMFPLKSHPDSYARAQTIICTKSLAILEDSLNGRPVAAPTCATDQPEKNIQLAEQLGIRSTPTLIFPDGRVLPGYRTGGEIVGLLDSGNRK